MIIELLNGTRYDVEDYGLARLSHPIPSSEIRHNTTPVAGLGDVITDTIVDQRDISVDFAFKVTDIYDYYLLRDEINALFLRKEPFYIIFKREDYKRWLVKTADQFQIPPTPIGGSFTVKFRTVRKFAESIASTKSDKEWDADVWWFNGDITWDEPLQYTFATNKFNIINLGNTQVQPEFMDFKITIKGTTTTFLKIKNLTNGMEYQYNGTLTASDTLVIDGVKSLKNGVSVFKDTTKTLLYLEPGLNEIEITGGTVISITFDFRFPFM